MNYILLSIFTISEALLCSYAVIPYSKSDVMMAAILTVIMSVGLTAYAFYTDRDFTLCGGTLLVALLCLLGVGFLNFFLNVSFLNTLIAYISVVIFSIYLIYDT